MKKTTNVFFALFVFFLSLGTQVTAQDDFPTGLNFDQNAYNSTLKIPDRTYTSGDKSDDMPFKASVKKFAPKIGNQGRIGSCVGWSVGYGALTIMHAQENKWDLNTRTAKAFSALYIYNNIRRGNCSTGSTLFDAGEFLKENGDYLSVDFDYPTDVCNRNANNAFRQAALDYKIKGFYSLFKSDDKAKAKIYNVKRSLANDVPVVIGMALRKNFFYPEGNYWNPNTGNTEPAGGHAMVVVGYDDAKKAFELMNSWGTAWGNEGYIWVKYKDFAQFVLGAYQYTVDTEVVPDPEDNDDPDPQPDVVKKAVNYRGAFEFGVPVFNDDESISFKSLKAVKAGEYSYKLDKKDWEVGDMYQLRVAETQKSRAIYVFSIDGEGSNIHWPRDERLNSKFLGSGETPIIPYENVNIMIPGKDRALTKRIEGDDNICILYAYGEIEDFKERVEKVKNASGSIDERFKAGFGDMIVPADDLTYSNGKMKFIGQSKSGKYVVPILLTVEGE